MLPNRRRSSRTIPICPCPEDVADAFVSYESQRIQNVLKVSGEVGDEAIEGAGARGVHATHPAALEPALDHRRLGREEPARGGGERREEGERARSRSRRNSSAATSPPHWAPKDAADVIFDAGVADPERVLRDAAASDQQKRHALYALLATSSPTEQQQMWLSSVIEGLLK